MEISNTNRLEKKLLGITRSRKPKQVVLIAFFVLFITLILFVITVFPLGLDAALDHLWIFVAFAIYLVLVFIIFFLLTSEFSRRKPCRRAWLYRASDAIMLFYSSLMLFEFALLAGVNSIISSLITADGQYILIALYLSVAAVIGFSAPSITKHNLQNMDNPAKLLGLSNLVTILGIIFGASLLVARILILTISGQMLLFLSFISFMLVSFFLICIAMIIAYELIILVSRGMLASEHHQP
jgi:hypothetical protein